MIRKTFFSPQGQQVSVVSYRNGEPYEGEATYFHFGRKTGEEKWKEGNQVMRIFYYENGQKKTEDEFVSGQRIRHTSYNLQAQVVGVLPDQDGSPHDGRQEIFYENGRTRNVQEWAGGRKTREISYWENGQRQMETEWVEGKAIKNMLWTQDGEPIIITPPKKAIHSFDKVIEKAHRRKRRRKSVHSRRKSPSIR